jgi:DNA-binding transcriptional LysR family regulator
MLDERRNGDFSTLGRSSPIVLQHLRYAVSAAEHGSFRRAAEALLLRQSTLSRCVRQLEESTGLIVFERFSGGVRPTQAGQEFLRNARSILEQVDALAATAHSTGRGEAGRLAIGFYTSLSAGNLRATLTDVSQRFPQLEIELTESSRKRALECQPFRSGRRKKQVFEKVAEFSHATLSMDCAPGRNVGNCRTI